MKSNILSFNDFKFSKLNESSTDSSWTKDAEQAMDYVDSHIKEIINTSSDYEKANGNDTIKKKQ